jgi:hypothetical protein
VISEHLRLTTAQMLRHLVFQFCASNLRMRAGGEAAFEAELFQENVTTCGLCQQGLGRETDD